MHNLLEHTHQWALINDIISKLNKLTQPALAEVDLYRNRYAPRGMDAGSRCAKQVSLWLHPWVQLTMCDRSMSNLQIWRTGHLFWLQLWCHCLDLKCLSTAINAGWAYGHIPYVNVIKDQSGWIWYGYVLCLEIIFLHNKMIIRLVRTACSLSACSVDLQSNIFSHLSLVR